VAPCARASLQSPGDEKPKVVVRPYTPVSAPDAAGYMDLVVKAYAQGKMSKHMGDMKVCGGNAYDNVSNVDAARELQ
jgi:cytochrome-b5 reductase